jgi:nucleosome binding factor SPN SPT16 subunit
MIQNQAHECKWKADILVGVPNNDNPLHFGTILCSLGAKFKYYCPNVARTYLIDPSKVLTLRIFLSIPLQEQEECYKLLLEVELLLLKNLKPGVQLNNLMIMAQNLVESRNASLAAKFGKNCGFGVRCFKRKPDCFPRWGSNSKSQLTLSTQRMNEAPNPAWYSTCQFHFTMWK